MAAKFDLSIILKLIDQVTPGMQKFSRDMKKIGANMRSVGRSMSIGLTAPIVGFATKATMTGIKFQEAMNMVGAVARATPTELTKLRNEARRLGAETRYTAIQVAEAMKFEALAGLKFQNMMKATPRILELAASAQLDVASAADIVTNIMAGYKGKVPDLVDVNNILVETFTNTKTDLVDLGYAFRKAGPVASKMGLSFAKTAAILGLLAQAGFRGEEAGVGLRRILTDIVKPSSEARKGIAFLELEFKKAGGDIKEFNEIIKEFEEAEKKGATETQVLESAMRIFQLRGGPQFLALLRAGSGDMEKLTEQLESVKGSMRAAEVASAQMKDLPGDWYRLVAAFEAVKISFTEMEAGGKVIQKVFRKITEVLRKIASIDPELLEQLTKLSGIVALGGPLLLGLGALAAAIGALATPIGLVVVGLAAMVGLLIYIRNTPFMKKYYEWESSIPETPIDAALILFDKFKAKWKEHNKKMQKPEFAFGLESVTGISNIDELINKFYTKKTALSEKEKSQIEVLIRILGKEGFGAEIENIILKGITKVNVENESEQNIYSGPTLNNLGFIP